MHAMLAFRTEDPTYGSRLPRVNTVFGNSFHTVTHNGRSWSNHRQFLDHTCLQAG